MLCLTSVLSRVKIYSMSDERDPRVTVKIPRDIHKRLKLYAVQTDQEVRELLRVAIEEYLSRAEQDGAA